MAYIITCTLMDSENEVSRTFALDSETTFFELQQSIQKCFGFEDQHLWVFEGKDMEISLPEFNDDGLFQNFFDAKETNLARFFGPQLLPRKPYKRLLYVYDFGDNRTFEILFKGEKETEKVPTVIETKGGMIMENIGGVGGRDNMIEIGRTKDKKGADRLGRRDTREDFLGAYAYLQRTPSIEKFVSKGNILKLKHPPR